MATLKANEGKNKVCEFQGMSCIRKVSNLERIYLWSPYSNVSMIARIKGNVSEEKLEIALDKLREMHPLLGAKVVFDEDQGAWFSNEDVPKSRFRVVNRISDTQWFEELQHDIQLPFDIEKGPLIRFILVHSEEVSDLVIICNHSVCDGMSLANLVRDVLSTYQNPEQNLETIYPPDVTDFLPEEGFSISSVMMRHFISRANNQWKKKPYTFTCEDSAAIQNAYWDKNLFKTVILELEPSETRKLSKKCRDNGVTVGSAVTAAFIAAHDDVAGSFVKNQKQIWIPFDMRRHTDIRTEDVFCFYVGALQLKYQYDAKRSFWKNVSSLHKNVEKRIEKLISGGLETPDFDPTLLDALSTFAPFKEVVPEAYNKTENLLEFSKDEKNTAFSFAKKSKYKVPGTISSNLGRLKIPETYGDLQIERMIFLPGISESVPLTLGGISIGDRTVFSMIYPEKRGTENSLTMEMIQIRNRVLEYLGFGYKVNELLIS